MQSFGGFSALAEAMNGAADGKSARVSERKRRNCAFVYGGDIRSHEYKRMGTPLPSVAAASNSRIAEQKARMSSNLITKGGRLPRHPDDTYHFMNLEQVF